VGRWAALADGFVTDGSSVSTLLTINPSLTIAALAERASGAIARCAADAGIAVTSGVPVPGSA
jgi:choline dehydrogenase-like flavoprotein